MIEGGRDAKKERDSEKKKDEKNDLWSPQSIELHHTQHTCTQYVVLPKLYGLSSRSCRLLFVVLCVSVHTKRLAVRIRLEVSVVVVAFSLLLGLFVCHSCQWPVTMPSSSSGLFLRFSSKS